VKNRDARKAAQPLEQRAAGVPDEPGGALFDCWNKSGVEGNGTCRELEKFIHCRNCPVYSNAGLQLLNRELSPEYRREWTEHFARKGDPAAAGKTSVVVFRVGRDWLALPTPVFQEIVEHRPVHSIPHRRGGIVLGLVNVRGELILCVCVARLLGLGEIPLVTGSTYRRLLVVAWDGRRLVFPANEVHGIHRLAPEEPAGAKAAVKPATALARTVFRWQDKVVGLLEPELLFSTLNRSLL
jgi:chemotaxis-related protein WspD